MINLDRNVQMIPDLKERVLQLEEQLKRAGGNNNLNIAHGVALPEEEKKKVATLEYENAKLLQSLSVCLKFLQNFLLFPPSAHES